MCVHRCLSVNIKKYGPRLSVVERTTCDYVAVLKLGDAKAKISDGHLADRPDAPDLGGRSTAGPAEAQTLPDILIGGGAVMAHPRHVLGSYDPPATVRRTHGRYP